jgi:hypothetical protein
MIGTLVSTYLTYLTLLSFYGRKKQAQMTYLSYIVSINYPCFFPSFFSSSSRRIFINKVVSTKCGGYLGSVGLLQ